MSNANQDMPRQVRRSDGLLIEDATLRLAIHQAASAQPASAGALSFKIWGRRRQAADAAMTDWELLSGHNLLSVPEAALRFERSRLSITRIDRAFPFWRASFDLELDTATLPMVVAGCHLLTICSLVSFAALHTFGSRVGRKPVQREIEATRCLVAALVLDQEQDEIRLANLADAVGRPWFPVGDELYRHLVLGQILRIAFGWALLQCDEIEARFTRPFVVQDH